MGTSSSSPSTLLSADIRLLGDLLGKIIQEQQGISSFDLVEKVRLNAKARRSGDESAAQELLNLIKKTSLEEKSALIKAFSNYFQLINIAEDQQRIRVLRQRERDNQLEETIDGAIKALKDSGYSAERMHKLLAQLRLRFVLTAHPSEAKRQEILVKLRNIAQMMTRQERENLIPIEEDNLISSLAEEIEALWQTRAVRNQKKTVLDEVNFGLYFVTSVIMDVVVEIYDEFYASLQKHFPERDWSDLHRFLRYGSWIGGDRDGNPNVTTDITLETLEIQRDAARAVYLEDLRSLIDHLTQATETAHSTELLTEFVPASESDLLFSDELYRESLVHIIGRLERDEYDNHEDLFEDLKKIQNSLSKNRGKRVAAGKLRRLLRKVRLFGLQLMPLDIREDARLYAGAVAELMAAYGIAENYQDLPEAEKQKLLIAEINNPRPFFPPDPTQFGDTVQHVVKTWQMIAKAHKRYGTECIDAAIASMSQYPSDVLTMLLFAKEVGVQDDIDIAPLFEKIDDLRRAPEVMQTLFENPTYAEHLEKRDKRQSIMIGYSDSSKDGGYIASNWHLYQAQRQLSQACDGYGIEVELFHGRGGSIGRGGGPANRAILSQPAASLRGGIKITEQGEVIAYRYSNRDIARRHLQQVLNAVMLVLGDVENDHVDQTWSDAMSDLSEYGSVHYRDLVYETESFLDYWQQATPINELSQLRISSRPAKRKGSGGFAAMRAIPWVFSWMQSRAIIPSWFGVGTAIQRYCDTHENGMETLQSMYKEWRFFDALIRNTELDVAKADMGIAKLYSELVDNVQLREQMFSRISDEHQLTQKMICAVTGQNTLLEYAPALQRSIERRNPYIDPLNFIQVDLLQQLRALPDVDTTYRDLLEQVLGTINGIAAGMKTTG